MANKARTEGGAARPTIPGPSGRAAPGDSGSAVKRIWRAGLKGAGQGARKGVRPDGGVYASEYTKEKK